MNTETPYEVEVDENGDVIDPVVHVLTDEEAAEIESALEPTEIEINLSRFWRRQRRQLGELTPSKHRISAYRTKVSSEVGTLATKTPPWKARRKRRAQNKVARRSRQANR